MADPTNSYLSNFFIPPCFRPNAPPEAKTLTDCLVGDNGAIPYWTEKLFTIVAVVAFFYVVYGGFMMMTAYGNETKYAEAKKTVLYALFGMIIATLAAVLVNAFVEFLGTSSLRP